jgi:hypothetical protein
MVDNGDGFLAFCHGQFCVGWLHHGAILGYGCAKCQPVHLVFGSPPWSAMDNIACMLLEILYKLLFEQCLLGLVFCHCHMGWSSVLILIWNHFDKLRGERVGLIFEINCMFCHYFSKDLNVRTVHEAIVCIATNYMPSRI